MICLIYHSLEADELSIISKPLDLKTWLHGETDKLQPLLMQKQLLLHIEAPDNLPMVLGDIDRISQVFINLITNAIRHSPEQALITVSLCSKTTCRNQNH